MRISQIKEQINKNYIEIKELQSKISILNKINGDLVFETNLKLIEYFKEYIEIGYTYTVNGYFHLTGDQTGLKNGEDSISPFFRSGDVFKIIKKNNKSFIIKQIKKVDHIYINGIKQSDVITEPNYTFRVDINNLYERLYMDKSFKDSFEKYVTRKESLEILDII